jgi:putative ABC transport system permease protein
MKPRVVRLAFRFLLRERRAGELHLLLLALIIAIASLSSVGFLADRVKGGLERESHQMLGADLLLLADHPWPIEFAKKAGERRLSVAQAVTFPSMISAARGEDVSVQLADVKAVTAAYPLRGRLRIVGRAGEVDAPTDTVPGRGKVWIDDRLAAALDVVPGATVSLGKLSLEVAALLTFEPDRGLNLFSVAPRLLMNLDDLPASGLIQQGSRVSYRLLLAGEAKAVDEYKAWAGRRMQRGERLEDPSNARPEVRSVLDRAQRFLGLTALLAVVLAAVGVALAVRRYIQRHLDPFAVMRCLGATQPFLFRLALVQFVVLGVIGSACGIALGYAGHWLLHALLAELINTPLPPPTWQPVAQGAVVGLVLVLAFALPPILQLKRVPTVLVLRRELGAPEVSAVGSYALGGAALIALLFWTAGEATLGLWATGGFVACLALFSGLGLALVKLAGRLARWLQRGRGRSRSPWRLGVLSLARRPGAAALQILALSIGFLALLLLTVTRNEVLQAWQQSVPPEAPNRFVINIQPEQADAVQRYLQKNGVAAALAPMVRGRLSSRNGKPISGDDFPDDRAKRLVEREFNLSWRADLPEDNVITAGRWFTTADRGASGKAAASVEEGLAQTLGLRVGDDIVFTIAGSPLDARVVGLRKLNWDSMRVNFFVLFPPHVIDDQPTSYITSFFLPPGGHDVASRLVREFPNLTVIDVSAILRQLQSVIGQVTLAVEFLFAFTLLAGFVVLYAALLAVIDERRQELAILRALGAGRRQLQLALASEFALIGGISGLLASLGALAVGQGLAFKVFELITPPPLWVIPTAVGGGAALVALSGTWAIRRLLATSPLEAIRAAT